MNWDLLKFVPAFFIVAMFLVLLWGANQMWKSNNKFLSFIFSLVAIGIAVLGYAIYGQYIV